MTPSGQLISFIIHYLSFSPSVSGFLIEYLSFILRILFMSVNHNRIRTFMSTFSTPRNFVWYANHEPIYLGLSQFYSERLITDEEIHLGQVYFIWNRSRFFLITSRVIFTALFRHCNSYVDIARVLWSVLIRFVHARYKNHGPSVETHVHVFFHLRATNEGRTNRELFLELFSLCSLSSHTCFVYQFIPSFCFSSDCSSVILICSLCSQIVLVWKG